MAPSHRDVGDASAVTQAECRELPEMLRKRVRAVSVNRRDCWWLHGERWFLLGVERWIETEVRIMEGESMTKRRNSTNKFQGAWREGRLGQDRKSSLSGKYGTWKGTR